jgi:toxin ParE1/3/4
MGRPGRTKGTRELVISRTPFIAVYRLKGARRIEIIRLLHASQQWPPEGRR